MPHLRIAHVTNEPFGPQGANGIQQAAFSLARAQTDLGQAVAVFSRDDDAVHVLADGAASSATRVSPGGRPSLAARALSRYAETPMLERVFGWAPTIVHFHSVHIPQNVVLAAHLGRAGIPYCITVHGALFPPALRRGRLRKAVFDVLFERRYLNQARFVHALSRREEDAIRRFGLRCPIVMVPNGLPPGSSRAPSDADALVAEYPWLRGRRVFIFIGRLDTWQKGLDLLVEAFSRARLDQAGLVLVGPDCRGSVRELGAIAERHDGSSRIVFVPPTFGERLTNLLAGADVFVHPSRWEGLSLSVLAAAAAGKPCLITREADPLGELERADGAMFVEADVASVTVGLQRAAACTPGELQAMGARARHAVERSFSWPTIAREMLAAYAAAIGDQ